MANFLVCHGAWSGGWSWARMREPIARRGHSLLTPTYTGLGERSHLRAPMIDLDLHIADIAGVIEFEDLRKLVLIGHSYGGMVATGVADRMPDRVTMLIYLDAFVPEDGESVLDLRPVAEADRMRDQVSGPGDGWRLPPPPLAPDVAEEDFDWLNQRRSWMPFRTYTQRIKLTGAARDIPGAYIHCTGKSGGDPFKAMAERIRARPGWRCYELDAGHTPNITMPETLAELLDQIVGGGAVH